MKAATAAVDSGSPSTVKVCSKVQRSDASRSAWVSNLCSAYINLLATAARALLRANSSTQGRATGRRFGLNKQNIYIRRTLRGSFPREQAATAGSDRSNKVKVCSEAEQHAGAWVSNLYPIHTTLLADATPRCSWLSCQLKDQPPERCFGPSKQTFKT